MRMQCSKTWLSIAGIVLLAACSEPKFDVVDARRAVEDYRISAVSFRSIDRFFPTAVVRRGEGVTPLKSVASELSDKTLVDIGEGPVELAAALRATDTNALLVLKGGDIVFERYFNGADENSRFIGWSISKSIVSLLVGIAVSEGHIHDIDDAADRYWPELANTPYAGVSIRDLLQMRAGVNYSEWTRFGTADVDVLADQSLFRGERRFTDLSQLELQRVAEPGTAFNYSSLTSTILGRVVEEATGSTLAEYTEATLWQPAGMQADGFWMLDGDPPDGHAFGGGGFNAVARDYARLGLMVLRQGQINNRQIVPTEWIRDSVVYEGTEPVLPRTPRGYGFQWWTFLGTDIHEAVGIHGQFISIDPVTDTVIVKTSYWPERGGGERANMLLLNALRAEVAGNGP